MQILTNRNYIDLACNTDQDTNVGMNQGEEDTDDGDTVGDTYYSEQLLKHTIKNINFMQSVPLLPRNMTVVTSNKMLVISDTALK